jgi:uncharacterized protein (DUF302 family)
MSFDDAVTSAKQVLQRHNFRVLTEINMKDNFKKGLNLDFRPYISSTARFASSEPSVATTIFRIASHAGKI